MIDDDPYVANGPISFKYKLYKVDMDGNYVEDQAVYPDTSTIGITPTTAAISRVRF